YANDQPLIVLDGFPIEGDIRDINPNDVESVTLLKDAAAASIWGTRAANGVIVVTSKKGGFNRRPEIEIINQATVGSKPNLFYLPQMSTSDYIDLETSWFNAGRYNSYATALPQNKPVLSPVISILMDKRDGRISATDADNRLNALRNIDVRKEATSVFFHNSIKQQHQANLRGGSDKVNYYFSAGYDRVLGQERGDDMDRLTLRSENTFRLLPSLTLQAGFMSTWGKQYRNGMGLKGFQGNTADGFAIASPEYSFYPYQQLINPDGSAALAPRLFNKDYIDYLTSRGFEDWSYRPADELKHLDNTTQQKHLVVTTQLNYKLNNALTADLKYQYESQDLTTNNYQPVALYNTRNTINTYTRFVLPDSSVVKQVPYGDILDYALTNLTTHNFRGQLNFNKRLHDHQLAAIGGMEVREIITSGRTIRNYGFDNRTLTYANIDYNARFPTFPSGVVPVPGVQTITYVQDRYVSYYANASYTYRNRYTFSLSGRMDDSNLFGIDPKDRNVPLWSTGVLWNIDKEPFFRSNMFSLLRLRSTYGFNGNISKTQTAYPVAVAARDNFTNLPLEAITSAGNPYLQWEKMAQWNLALDFSLLKDHLSGSVEWFSKKGLSLLGDQYLDPSSGFQTIRANSANMKGKGVDVELNLKVGNKVQWQSKIIFSYATDKITSVANLSNAGTYRYVNADKQLMPLVGRPVYAIYSFQWGGLDKDGNPQLIGADGKTGNYNTILNSLPPEQLV
ncbi:MAG: TonB-dependent receptor, partial [Bacteroidetes bacterium]|nr:TonB-dependent receptor [Bacteroidota bacterium]